MAMAMGRNKDEVRGVSHEQDSEVAVVASEGVEVGTGAGKNSAEGAGGQP